MQVSAFTLTCGGGLGWGAGDPRVESSGAEATEEEQEQNQDQEQEEQGWLHGSGRPRGRLGDRSRSIDELAVARGDTR